MRAVRVHETGEPEVLQVEEVPDPAPDEGEVLIRAAAIGVNFVDVYTRRGQNQKPVPFTVGQEVAGVVEELGAGVTDVAVGDRVATNAAKGAYAERAVAPAEKVVRVPDGIELETAATAMVQGLTAHYLATRTYPLAPGETALVHAGAGGVGLLLTQVAKLRGAQVITTVSSEDKERLSREAGADEVIRYTEVDFRDAVLGMVPDGVPVVYDSVGRDTFDRSLACLRPLGMLALYGESSGPVDPFDPKRLNQGGSLFLTRPSGRHYMRTAEQLRTAADELFAWIADGRVNVRIGETHPLEDAALAQERLETRRTTGKVLLIP